jgi:methylmalonyl-CoA mutase N-terminal domain/subunit
MQPGEKVDIKTHPHDPTTAQRQIDRLKRVRRERNQAEVDGLLDRLIEVARDEKENIMPATIELVRAGASMGEIVEKLKVLWGTYRETPVF